MADRNGSASTADAPPQDPYAIPMSINVADIAEEDEDEYEYEYSTTETEVLHPGIGSSFISTNHVGIRSSM